MSDAGALADALRRALASHPPQPLCVGYSGGPDSTALLHALAQAPEARQRGLRALHVDHQLHADSAAWADHCAEVCARIAVPFAVAQVHVDHTRGEGLEAAARRARYAAFAAQLRDHEYLLLAHHRDDQVETILLRLLRGAGPEGLAGMRALRPFARGQLWRPLLEVPLADLRAYAAAHALACIDDPANRDPRFARNILRHDLLPRIAAYWPHAASSILHAARLCNEAARYLDQTAAAALAGLRRHADTLDAHGWSALPPALRAPVLDAWLHARGLTAPPDCARRELQRQLAVAATDRVPRLTWPGTDVRIWDARLHASPPLAPVPADWQVHWDGAPIALPADCGTLTLMLDAEPSLPAARLDPPLTLRLRRGGERLQPVGDPHTRELRDLWQRARMPPWLRERCPLLIRGDELIAVADLWHSRQGEVLFTEIGARPRWQRPAWALL